MKIPVTKHLKVKYRNGDVGFLLTTERESMHIPVMTLKFKGDSLIYHSLEGKYLGLKEEHPLDIVEIEYYENYFDTYAPDDHRVSG